MASSCNSKFEPYKFCPPHLISVRFILTLCTYYSYEQTTKRISNFGYILKYAWTKVTTSVLKSDKHCRGLWIFNFNHTHHFKANKQQISDFFVSEMCLGSAALVGTRMLYHTIFRILPAVNKMINTEVYKNTKAWKVTSKIQSNCRIETDYRYV
jgi:hypothetical protein